MLRSLARRARFLARGAYDRLVPPRRWDGVPHPVFARFGRFETDADGRFAYDFLGGRTDPKFRAAYRADTGRVAPAPPTPSFQYVEWTFQLERVVEHAECERPFVFVELGAGYGAWMGTIANAFRRLGRDDARVIGVELDPARFGWIAEHMANNDVAPERWRALRAGVAAADGETALSFDPRPDVAYGFGLGSRGVGPPETVPLRTIPTLLADEPRIDLMHVDVQGAEAEALPAAREFLRERVAALFVATHGAAIHRRLRRMLHEDGWTIDADHRPGRRERTPFGDHWFLDGVLAARRVPHRRG